MDIHCQRDKNRVTLFSSKYNIPKTIIFDISRAHLSVSFFFFALFRFFNPTLHIICKFTEDRYALYTHTHIERMLCIINTCTLFMYHVRRVWNVILLDVQLTFTVSPTLYSDCTPEIHGPSPRGAYYDMLEHYTHRRVLF